MSNATLIKCRKCLTEIDDGGVKCFLCSSRFHNKCRNLTNELSELIEARKVFIICDQCEIKFAPDATPARGLKPTHKRDNIPKKNGQSARKKEIC